MIRKTFFFLLLARLLSSQEVIDLEDYAQDFVLEAKQIEIPGYPYAFNPSLIRWRGFYLLSFRIIPNRSASFTSYVGLILLDDDFNPVSDPQILDTRGMESMVPSRAEDARLIYIGEKIYMVYSDNSEVQIAKGGFRVYLSELTFDGAHFQVQNIESLLQFEGETRSLREKNWVPFDYQGNLVLAYSFQPHKIFLPLRGTNSCETLFCTSNEIDWPWGILRGGTPGLAGALERDEYLAFFHTSLDMVSEHSDSKKALHYFMGAYTFSAEPPFEIKRMSAEPIVGQMFYKGAMYKPYWHPVRVVFPGGFVFDENYIYVAYGRQDHEIWIATLDRKKLIDSLLPVPSLPQ